MSNITDSMKKITDSMEENRELLRKQREIQKHNIDRRHDEIVRNKEEEERFKKIDLSQMDEGVIRNLQIQGEEYIKAAKKSMIFVNEEFNGVVPFFAKNLLLVGAATGQGKSTLSANITYSCLLQGKRVLVLTNEQWENDIYNAVTALIKGWQYKDHDKITPEEAEVYKEYIPKLSKRLTVIGDNYMDAVNCTTSLEGIQTLLNSLVERGIHYDVIIIDYIQNVSMSKQNPRLEKWQVLERLATFLDGFKNRYDAPIVMLSQLKPSTKDADIDFKDRIEGRKSILNSATFAMEARSDREKRLTVWKVHKSRFKSIGKEILTGYDNGRFVKYNGNFMESVEKSDINSLLSRRSDESEND